MCMSVCVCDSVLLWISPAESRLCYLRTSFNLWNPAFNTPRAGPRIFLGGQGRSSRVEEVHQDMIFVRFSEKLHEIKTYLS